MLQRWVGGCGHPELPRVFQVLYCYRPVMKLRIKEGGLNNNQERRRSKKKEEYSRGKMKGRRKKRRGKEWIKIGGLGN